MPIHRTTNPYLNKFKNTTEQSLLKDLAAECIAFNGIDVLYLPKTNIAFDDIFHEEEYATFENYYQLPIYIESADGFQGQGDFLQKFGLEIDDQLEVSVDVNTFESIVPNRTKPLEGDLIYFPILNKLMEIHFNENELQFYTLGINYYYKLTLKLFTYSGEEFNTGYENIDSIEDREVYKVELELGSGSGSYIIDEAITQTNSNATGFVASYNAVSNVLFSKNNVGTFIIDENVTGLQSNAVYKVSTVKDQSTEYPYGDNEDIESNADPIIDETEDNPFGEF